MPKQKSNSGASKRFKTTASGKVRFKHAFKNHILTKKSKKSKRALGHAGYVPSCDEDRMRKLINA
jgi:large subunit ribosomal protein L35